MKKLILLSILAVFISSVSFGQSNGSFNKLFIKDKIEFKDGKTTTTLTPAKVKAYNDILLDTANVGTTALDAGPDTILTKNGVHIKFTPLATLNPVRVGAITADAGPDTMLTKNGVHIKYVPVGITFSAYSSGNAINLTATPAYLDFSTADPTITITSPGTYLILSGANYGLVGATYADSSRTAFCKLYRSNNTPAYLTEGYDIITLPICTTSTAHAGTVRVPAQIYTTTNSDDVIRLYGNVSTTPSAGNVVCRRAFITAYRIK